MLPTNHTSKLIKGYMNRYAEEYSGYELAKKVAEHTRMEIIAELWAVGGREMEQAIKIIQRMKGEW